MSGDQFRTCPKCGRLLLGSSAHGCVPVTACGRTGDDTETLAETRLVRQEHAWGCGIAALAMVTGQTYDEVRTWVLNNWVAAAIGCDPSDFLTKTGVTQYALDWYLGQHGYAWRRVFKSWVAADAWPPEPFAPVHIAQVVQPSGNAHFVVLTSDGQVLDPMSDEPRSLSGWEQVNHVQGIWPSALLDDAEEYDEILRRQSELLTGVANALRGDPPPLTAWSHHDLPKRARVAADAVAGVLALADEWETKAATAEGLGFGPQTFSVPFVTARLRAVVAPHTDTEEES